MLSVKGISEHKPIYVASVQRQDTSHVGAQGRALTEQTDTTTALRKRCTNNFRDIIYSFRNQSSSIKFRHTAVL